MYLVIQQFIYLYSDTKTVYILWYVGLLCVCVRACMRTHTLLYYWIGIRVELSRSIGSSKLSLKAILLHDKNKNYQIPVDCYW
jgi:hypothetical protein